MLPLSRGRVNNNPKWLTSYGISGFLPILKGCSAAPGRDREDAIRLAEIASRRCDDGALGEDESSTSLDGQPDVLFANELERRRTIDGTV